MTQISQEVLAVLSTLEIKGCNVKITEQLDRKQYLNVNEVLERVGGKWSRKHKVHIFDSDPTDRLNNVIECGVMEPKVKTGYFPTPPEIVSKMIELADINRGHLILEPSAGQGHIADMICEELRLPPSQALVMMCEILPENKSILRKKGHDVEECEFLEFAEECRKQQVYFDRILMNPPFESQKDLTHVTAAFNLLADGGVLVAIMSAGVTFRNNRKTLDFREQIMDPYSTHFEKLPEGAFKPSGTMVNTVMVRLEK